MGIVLSMPDLQSALPLSQTVAPTDQATLAKEVRAAHDAKTPIYPIGGGTSLAYGLPAKEKGLGLSTAALNRVVDYPARDMTITVEAGITMSALSEMLAAEGQQLPIDVPFPERATLGGVIATNWSGPRRFGHGTIRDYVIGISAVDGRGVPFKAGGRVVKNVAGYDFCKLLTGSLGTLAVITQVTLKVKPRPAAWAWVTREITNVDQIEESLAQLGASQTTPIAIELLGGPAWQSEDVPAGLREITEDFGRIAVKFEGTLPEVRWMDGQLDAEWRQRGVNSEEERTTSAVTRMDAAITHFAAATSAPLVVRFNLCQSHVAAVLKRLDAVEIGVSFQAHAGNGILNVCFHDVAPADVSRLILKELQPLASANHGNVIVLSCPGQELTRQLTWGVGRGDRAVMQAVKRQFDPAGILNPDRFVY